MSCRSCHFSTDRGGVLWCLLKGKTAVRRCPRFTYEPGTDEVSA